MDSKQPNTTNKPTPQPLTQPEDIRTEQEKPRSLWPTIAFFSILFALIAGTAAVVMWMTRDDERAQVAALERDMTVLKARLSTAEREKTTLERQYQSAQSAELISTASDEEQITTVAKQYSSSFMSDPSNSVVTLEKKEDDQAVVVVQKNNISYNVYLKKMDATWSPVWAGKGGPDESQRKFYNLTIE